jgi:N,N'-diacetyllegionaminate synthase
MTAVRIGKHRVGPGEPCFIAAEIGINHNGDLDLGRRMIDAAADAGADAVKLQNYRTEDFVVDRALTHEYRSRGVTVVESQYDMFKRCELGLEQLRALKTHADGRGLVLFSTPTSPETLADLLAIDVAVLKNGSDYLGHLPLIRAMAKTGLPTILSTGMATAAEMDEAVRAYRGAGGDQLVLLHCTSSYPTPPEHVNLRKIGALTAAFGCPVGFSDHTAGAAAAIGAVALGACCIEKHFTLDHDLPGPDHWFSSDPRELRELVTAVRALERALGESRLGPAESEAPGRRDYRLSCSAARPLPRGHALEEKDISFRRPGTGMPPALADHLIGRQLARDVPAGHVFTGADLR